MTYNVLINSILRQISKPFLLHKKRHMQVHWSTIYISTSQQALIFTNIKTQINNIKNKITEVVIWNSKKYI